MGPAASRTCAGRAPGRGYTYWKKLLLVSEGDEAQLDAAEPLKGEDGADGRHFWAPAVLGPLPALAETFNGGRSVIIDGDTFGLGLERVRIGLGVDALVRVLNQCAPRQGRFASGE